MENADDVDVVEIDSLDFSNFAAEQILQYCLGEDGEDIKKEKNNG